ncbi:efflux RND transporter periplasmic adaptor subunit [Bacteroidota bacterium]
MKKVSLIIGGIIVVAVILFFAFKETGKTETTDIIVPVKQGKFIVDITTTGELEAKNSVKITGPTRLRNFRIHQITIDDIIDEGTVVRKGDWIADLDRSEFNDKFQDKELEVEQAQNEYIQMQLDTTLQLRQSRDELVNLKYAVEEAKLVLEQSQYEPPATIKQQEYNLDKAIRNYEQAKDNYQIKLEQNGARMYEEAADLTKRKRQLANMMAVADQFTITAPEPGMVVYHKGWDGKAIKEGSQISVWNPTVATLPDLTKMLSKTYINEVDVRKVKPGQKVEIGLDAFPEKKLTGVVTNVANVGEQRPNSDAKVFQATIEIDQSDDMLRPAMTTSNKIIAKELDSVLYIPLECLQSKDDSISYVYKRKGINHIKQEVQLGETNANEAVILLGLEEGDKLYLSVPGDDGEPIAMLAELDGKRNKEKKEPEVKKKGERIITLPDGRQITVPADGQRRDPGEQDQLRSREGGRSGQETGEQQKRDETSANLQKKPEGGSTN